VGPTVGLFGFLAQVNTLRAEKLHTCMALDIYITFGHWVVQAALDISNIRPLKLIVWYWSVKSIYVGFMLT